MEIRIDERLVFVFKELVEKDEEYFDGETNLEKILNTQLADFFKRIDRQANFELLSDEARDKFLEYLLDDIEDDEIGQGLAILAKILKAAASK